MVIPVHDNALALEELSSRLIDVLRKHASSYAVFLIDDGSKDSSWSVIQELARSNQGLFGMRLSRNFGQHGAIAAGLRACDADAVVLMDADLNDAPEEIPRLLKELSLGFDLVLTTRADRRRHVPSRLFHRLYSIASGTPDVPGVTVMRAFSASFLNAALKYSERGIVYGPLMHQMGFQTSVIEREYPPELRGTSSYSFAARVRLAVDALVGYGAFVYRCILISGLSLGALALAYALAVVVGYLLGYSLPVGGLTLILFIQLLSTGVILISLGVLAGYVFRIYGELLRRPRFLVASATHGELLTISDEPW